MFWKFIFKKKQQKNFLACKELIEIDGTYNKTSVLAKKDRSALLAQGQFLLKQISFPHILLEYFRSVKKF